MNLSINIKGILIDLSELKIMGIINATPDSFYKESRFQRFEEKIEEMVSNGVDIFDIGGYSTRPGAKDVDINEELKRVIPIIEIIRKKYPEIIISIDTFRASVAKEAIEAGAHIVNDVSGGDLDSDMFQTVAELQVPYILMHMRGNPLTMADKATYGNVTKEVIVELAGKINNLRKIGVKDIIIDPGFGFSKTIEQNFELLNNLELFQIFELPILVGLSRKSMIWKTLSANATAALNGTSVLNTKAAIKKANILRVHDVLEASELRKLLIIND